jgi:hypothetical protein
MLRGFPCSETELLLETHRKYMLKKNKMKWI